MENNLPENWAETLLSNVVFFQEGPGLRTYQMGKTGMPFLNIRTFNDDETLDKTKCKFVKMEEFKNKYEHFLLNEGDIVVSSSGTLGKAIVIRKEDLPVMLNTSVIRFRAVSEKIMTQKYLKYFLKSDLFYKQIQEQKTGMAIDNYGPSHLQLMQIVIPPLPEQYRIVSKLDAVMQKVESNKQRLEKIPKLLKRFRQSVLAAAVRGKLTLDWREKNSNVEIDKTKAAKKKNRTFLDDKTRDYNLFDLPSKWNWKTISDVADVKGGKRVPKGEALVDYDTGFPYIKAGDLKFGTVQKHKLEYLLPKTREKIKHYIISKGDVYITNVGACIGDAGIVPDDLDGANLTENALKMCNHEGVYNLFLSYWLQSPIAQDYIQLTILSAAQGKLALGRVEVFPIPLPPIEEQKEIVRRVEQLFAFADKLDARYTKAKTMLDKLPRSILAKAFRGELVPQNPDDEPASVLLERIKAEKEKSAKEKKDKK
jgi:type I restriction enzyme S subunit